MTFWSIITDGKVDNYEFDTIDQGVEWFEDLIEENQEFEFVELEDDSGEEIQRIWREVEVPEVLQYDRLTHVCLGLKVN